MPGTRVSPWAVLRRGEAVAPEASRRRADAQLAWLRDYAARRLNTRLIDERRTIPPYVALDFGNAGLFGPLIETRHGGTALRLADLSRVLEQLAAIDVGLATWLVTSLFPGTRALAAYGTEEVRSKWLPLLATGRTLGAYAQTEPAAGSDFSRVTTRARPAPAGGWRLSGDKHWIGNGSWAGVATVVAQLLGDTGEVTDMIALAVPLSAPGVTVGAEHLSSGLRGMVQSRLHFADVDVPESHQLGAGQSTMVAVDSMTTTRFALAAAGLGALRRILQLGHRFASRRQVSGGLLGERATTLAVLGEISAHVDIAEAVVYDLAARFDRGEPLDILPVTAAKVLVTEWAVAAADRLVQLLGGRGYDEANLAGRMYRDLRVYRIFEGATEVLTDFLGARALAQPDHVDHLLADAPDLAAEFRSAVAELAERKIVGHDAGTDRDWRRALAGNALAWTFAATALREQPGVSPHTSALASHHLGQALTQARTGSPHEAFLPGPDELAAAVTRQTERIGSVVETLEEPRTDLDPLLLP